MVSRKVALYCFAVVSVMFFALGFPRNCESQTETGGNQFPHLGDYPYMFDQVNGCQPSNSPMTGDIDDDGNIEIIQKVYRSEVGTDIYVFDTTGNVKTGWPKTISGQVDTDCRAAIADINNDKKDEIVFCLKHYVSYSVYSYYIHALDGNGNEADGWPKEFSAQPMEILLEDMDCNGSNEIICRFYDRTVWIGEGCKWVHGTKVIVYNSNGQIMASIAPSTICEWRKVSVADLDVDGNKEIIIVGSDQRIYIFTCTGALKTVFSVGEFMGPHIAVGDINEDGYLEIIVAKVLPPSSPSEWTGDTVILAYDRTGTVINGFPVILPEKFRLRYFGFTAIDGSGSLKILCTAMSGNATRLLVIDGDGRIPSGWPVTMADGLMCGNVAPVVTDIDGNGSHEVVYLTNGADGEIRLNAFDRNGQSLTGSPYTLETGCSQSTVSYFPVIADMDHDNKAELIFGYNKLKPEGFISRIIYYIDVFKLDGLQETAVWPVQGFDMKNTSACVKKPKIIDNLPDRAYVGNSLTITGENFGAVQGGSKVSIAGVSCPVLSWSKTAITCTVPQAALTGDLSVLTCGGESNKAGMEVSKDNKHADIVVDFGPTYGIWMLQDNSTWSFVHQYSPLKISGGDLDNNGTDDIIADFGPEYGVWARYNNDAWFPEHPDSPRLMVIGDVDGNGKDDIIAEFGEEYGIWIKYNGELWWQLDPHPCLALLTADMDGNGKDEVIINFGDTYGAKVWVNNSSWKQLSSVPPVSIVKGDLDGNGKKDLVVNFGGSYGIWIYYNNESYAYLHPALASKIVCADVDDNGKDDVIVDFGDPYGIWIWYNNSGWEKRHDLSSVSLNGADLNANGKADIIVDFGAPYGIWARYDDSVWGFVHPLSADSVTTCEADGQ